MKRKLAKLPVMTILAACFFMSMQAQVTIGTGIEPAKGALLDLKQKTPQTPATDNTTASLGLLLPRVGLTNPKMLYPMFGAGTDPATQYKFGTGPQAVDLSKADEDSKHTGLTVYSVLPCFTETSGKGGPGPYVWTGTEWIYLGNPNFIKGTYAKLTPDGSIPISHGFTQAFTVKTDALGNNLTYTWYVSDNEQFTGTGTKLASAHGNTLNFPDEFPDPYDKNSGTVYVRAVIENICDGTTKLTSNTTKVEITGGVPPCSQVTSVTLTPSADQTILTSGNVNFTAAANGSIDGLVYEWYVGTSDQLGNAVKENGQSGSTFSFSRSAAGTYYIWAKAKNDCSALVPSSATKVVTCTPPKSPASITPVSSSVCENEFVTLTVQKQSDNSGNEYVIDLYNKTTGALVVQGTPGQTQFIVIGSSATTIYAAKVRHTGTGISSDYGTATATVTGRAFARVPEFSHQTINTTNCTVNLTINYYNNNAWIDGDNTEIKVYSDAALTQELTINGNYVTVNLTSSTQYIYAVTKKSGRCDYVKAEFVYETCSNHTGGGTDPGNYGKAGEYFRIFDNGNLSSGSFNVGLDGGLHHTGWTLVDGSGSVLTNDPWGSFGSWSPFYWYYHHYNTQAQYTFKRTYNDKAPLEFKVKFVTKTQMRIDAPAALGGGYVIVDVTYGNRFDTGGDLNWWRNNTQH
jgi:hypothetical protein